MGGCGPDHMANMPPEAMVGSHLPYGNDAPEAMGGFDAPMMEAMPPEAMGSFDASMMQMMPPPAMAGMGPEYGEYAA